MKLRTTAILLAVLAALCGAYWLSLQWEEEAERRTAESKRIFHFEPERIQRLSIQRKDAAPTVAERDEQGTWTIVAPQELAANQVLYDRVAKAMTNLVNERTVVEEPDDLASYELDQPYLRVTADLEGGEAHRLVFGGLGPFRTNRYTRVDGGPVVLVPDRGFKELDRELEMLRHFYVLYDNELPVTRVECAVLSELSGDDVQPEPDTPRELRRAKPPRIMAVERRDDGLWHMTEPAQQPADQAAVEEFVRHLRFAKGERFVDEPDTLDVYGMDPPRVMVTAFLEGRDAPQTVYFGDFVTREEGDSRAIFVKRQGESCVFQADTSIVSFFPTAPSAWLEKRLLNARKESRPVRLAYTSGDVHVVLEREPGMRWRLTSPAGQEADQLAVETLVTAVEEMRGEYYYPEKWQSFGLDSPHIELAFTYAGEQEPAVVRVGALSSDEERAYVTQETGGVTTISKTERDWLEKDVFYFVDKRLLEFRPERLQSASLQFEGVAYRFEQGSNRWGIAEPAGKVWETQADMNALLEALAKLRAKDLAEGEAETGRQARFGFDDPVLRFEATRVDESGAGQAIGPLTIGRVSDENPHQRYATVAGSSKVYLVDQQVIDTVRDALRGIRDEQGGTG